MTTLSTLRAVLADDPGASARAAGLRYVGDEEPGYARRRCGKGFSYRDWRGRTVRDPALRQRFAALAVPPAWSEVWICRYRKGHIQATGRDAAGRKQYIYHPRWREARDRVKYDRMVVFGKLLPRIRERVDADLEVPGLTREKVLAAVVRLLETSLARVGNDQYARDNQSFGLTTIRKKHVEANGHPQEFLLEFEGKGGKPWRVEVDDPRVGAVVAECLETAGYELFKYFDDAGVKRDVTSDDVNEYLRDVAGAEVTAKDFRTWAGTVLCTLALQEVERIHPDAEAKGKLLRAIERVAEELGNTPAICRQAYIHPRVLDDAEEGRLLTTLEACTRERPRQELFGLAPEEAAVLAFLERGLDRPTERRG